MFQATVDSSYDRIESELDQFRGEAPPSPQRSSREVQEILAQIHQDPFDAELNVKRLKTRCRIRDHNISCRFRRVVGMLIKDYIEALRMHAACHLLETSQFTVFDIALSVGYIHPQTFYNAFRRQVGCTPTSYRGRNHRDEPAGCPSDFSEQTNSLQTTPWVSA